MFKKLLSTIFLLGITIAVLYPSKTENTEIFNYCYSLEKILFRNSISKRKVYPKSSNLYPKILQILEYVKLKDF